ncbi:hypothetical protein AOL_s00215g438 [Orbilia oligospora ATCC 24927]|uniref:Uncharacterized protein n=1 Tax=Arthrobotrys oligospora (strain ATCC 24927 / CBS 115.81 / DSM 1491) TaxID=756982 RepID=G1XSU0_ARTOA|nr:hypothetical protein AOL_s00215g438 [Orbilia oligospora ATCC 24927]EGX43702.1 hypothetical protein AOL_s00215g438 [Orbilia oligospora ATCC 24927]
MATEIAVFLPDKAFNTLKISGSPFRAPLISFHKQGPTEWLRFTLKEGFVEVLLVDDTTLHQIDDSASFSLNIGRDCVRGFNTPQFALDINIECHSAMSWAQVWEPVESKLEYYTAFSFKLLDQPDILSVLAASTPASAVPYTVPKRDIVSHRLPIAPNASLAQQLDYLEALYFPNGHDSDGIRQYWGRRGHRKRMEDEIEDEEEERGGVEEVEGIEEDSSETTLSLPFPDSIISGVGEISTVNQDGKGHFFEGGGSNGSGECSTPYNESDDEYELLRQRDADGTGWIFCIRRRTEDDPPSSSSPLTNGQLDVGTHISPDRSLPTLTNSSTILTTNTADADTADIDYTSYEI